MSIRSNERISVEADQYSMQQQHQHQPPIQYVNVERDENNYAPENVQGNQQCAAAQMVPVPDHQTMDHQYTNEMIDMNLQQQHHLTHDDPNASNDIRMQSTLCKWKVEEEEEEQNCQLQLIVLYIKHMFIFD